MTQFTKKQAEILTHDLNGIFSTLQIYSSLNPSDSHHHAVINKINHGVFLVRLLDRLLAPSHFNLTPKTSLSKLISSLSNIKPTISYGFVPSSGKTYLRIHQKVFCDIIDILSHCLLQHYGEQSINLTITFKRNRCFFYLSQASISEIKTLLSDIKASPPVYFEEVYCQILAKKYGLKLDRFYRQSVCFYSMSISITQNISKSTD